MFALYSENTWAMALPIPFAAPVIRAVFPSKLKFREYGFSPKMITPSCRYFPYTNMPLIACNYCSQQ